MRFLLIPFIVLFSSLLVPASSLAQSTDKDLAELRSCVLSMDNVTRVFVSMNEIKQAAEKDPSLQKSMSATGNDDDKGSQSIASLTAKLSAFPAIVAIIAKNRFTPHQFVVTEFALLQTSFAAAAEKAGAPREKLIGDAGVSAANLDFVQQHQAELEELSKKYPMQ